MHLYRLTEIRPKCSGYRRQNVVKDHTFLFRHKPTQHNNNLHAKSIHNTKITIILGMMITLRAKIQKLTHSTICPPVLYF